MNKELINKYKNEFNHWLNNETLQVFCNASKKWNTYPSENRMMDINWSMEEIPLIVINDEYVELRKALAEGKTIQWERIEDEWIDLPSDFEFNEESTKYHIDDYRIKPEEPKFKVGDWVKDFEKIYQIKTQKEADYLNSKDYSGPSTSLWKPSNWCWCPVFGLVKVICETIENGNPCYLCWNPWKKIEQKLNNLEPFIGQLPTYIKSKI